MTAQLTSLEYESDRELAEDLGRLSRRFPDLSEWWLHELARSAYERFRDAHVRTFVPLLVERQVQEVATVSLSTLGAAIGARLGVPAHEVELASMNVHVELDPAIRARLRPRGG